MNKHYSKIDSYTPRVVVLRFFATGGRVNMKEAMKRTGLGPKDLFGFVSKQGISYHRLIERCAEETYVEIDDIDFSNEIDDIISSGMSAVFDELKPYIERKPRIHPTIQHLNNRLEEEREKEYQAKLKQIKANGNYRGQ